MVWLCGFPSSTRIEKGDAFLFKPFEPHQIINDGDDDMVIYLIATNPFNESIYLPDEEKWIVKSPKIAKVRFDTEQIFPAKPAKQKTPRKAKRS
jgi:oxalate decarboxylase/phosphoglucose isomerase-like protein (cupin superfamily)